MKLLNESPEFTLQFNADDFVIPQGEFDVANEGLAYHILFVAKKWDKKVTQIGGSGDAIKPIKKAITAKPVAEEVTVSDVATEVKAAVTPKRAGRPPKNA